MTTGWLIISVTVVLWKSGSSSPCPQTARQCRECISAEAQCAWCADEIYGYSRCGEPRTLELAGCSKTAIIFPQRSQLQILQEKSLTPTRLVSPQAATLQLRKGAWATIPLKVQTVKSSLTVRLRHPHQVQLKVASDCKGFRWKKPVAKCEKVPPGEVLINITILLKNCMQRPKRVKLTPEGQTKSSFKVSVISTCQCDCELPDAPGRVGRERCSQHGNHTCGICVCNRGRSGKFCECEESPNDLQTCRAPGKKEVCSNQGYCLCGFCECFEKRYSGAFCECDQHSCERYESLICGGPARGYCMCGVCQCEKKYHGKACEIYSPNSSQQVVTGSPPPSPQPDLALGCRSPDGEVCSRRGRCEEGMCVCSERYTGKKCEKVKKATRSLNRVEQRKICHKTEPCVQCHVFSASRSQDQHCVKECSNFHFHYVSRLTHGPRNRRPNVNPDDVISSGLHADVTACTFKDVDGCSFTYTYRHQRHQHVIEAQRSKVCPVG